MSEHTRHRLMLTLSGGLALIWLAFLAYFYITERRTCAGTVIVDSFGVAQCVASGGVR